VRWVAKAIGMLRTTIHAGLLELKASAAAPLSKSHGQYARAGTRRRSQEVGQLSSHRGFTHFLDTKKKVLIGDFKNAGSEWRFKGVPEDVHVYDFIDPELGKVAPYGVYDLTTDTGWVNVVIDHDTAEFAVDCIRCWWREMGEVVYPHARRQLIATDCGGSNG
jgi:hypothetical protein